MNIVIGLLCWMHIIERHGRMDTFTPDYKVGRFYIGGISAFEFNVFNDALKQLADMQDISAEESNGRHYMLRLSVIAMTLCDRWGNRLYNHNAEATLRALQDLPHDLLDELAIAAAEKTGIQWVLPMPEYLKRFGSEETPEEALEANP